MDVNKTSKTFFQMSYSEIKKLQNTNNEISSENTNIEVTPDEEVVLNETSNIENVDEVSEVESVDEVSTVDGVEEVSTDVDNTVDTQVETVTSTNSTSEIKTMEEYTEILNNKFDELWDKFDGDTDKIEQYIKNNLNEYMDITGDGSVDRIDLLVWNNYFKECDYNGSTPEYKEKGKEYMYSKRSSFAGLIKQKVDIISSATNNTKKYDFSYFENIISLTSGDIAKNTSSNQYIKNEFLKNLDVSSIISQDNWEEKFDEIQKKLGISDSSIKELKEELYAAQEWAKNNSDNANYAELSNAYKDYQTAMEKYNNTDWDSLADHDYIDQITYQPLTKQEYWKQRWINISGNYDIDGDGKVTAIDIKNFSCEIDLDGDGTISDDERSFLKQVKEKMTDTVWKSSVKSGYYNSNTIDDVINNLEVFDEEWIEDKKEEVKLSTTAMCDYFTEEIDSGRASQTPHGVGDYDKRWLQQANAYGFMGGVKNGYMDGSYNETTASDYLGNNIYASGKDGVEHTVSLVDYYKTQTTYLHYIKSADLSKEELEEILSKINNASSSAQSQLTEIKAAVEEKLANFEV